jgi:hypothetical protein
MRDHDAIAVPQQINAKKISTERQAGRGDYPLDHADPDDRRQE